MATAAATTNASVKPLVTVPVRLAAATLENTGAPMEAPNSWKVLTMPEARPDSSGATSPSAVAAATTNRVPIPAAATVRPTTMATVPSHSTGTTNPAVATALPTTAIRRAPAAANIRPAVVAPAIVARATGRN